MSSSKINTLFYSPSVVIFLSDKMLNLSLVFVETVFKSINGCLLFSFQRSKGIWCVYRQAAKRKASCEFSAHPLLAVPEEAQVTLMASSCSSGQPRREKSTQAASNCGACTYTHTPKKYSISQELNSTRKYCFWRSSNPPKYWKLHKGLE